MKKTVIMLMKIVFGILLFAGLPLLGWGVTDTKGFFAHPARSGYVILVILLQVAVVVLYPEVGRQGTKNEKRISRQRWAVPLMQGFCGTIMFLVPWADRRSFAPLGGPGGSDFLRYAGLAFFLLGFILMNWAEARLGRRFSIQVAIQSGHWLETGGPFRFLRHPRYLGIIIYNIGIALVFRSGPGFILVAALTLVLLWRIRDEETLLRQEFGSEWEDYARKTRRLIPFLF